MQTKAPVVKTTAPVFEPSFQRPSVTKAARRGPVDSAKRQKIAEGTIAVENADKGDKPKKKGKSAIEKKLTKKGKGAGETNTLQNVENKVLDHP